MRHATYVAAAQLPWGQGRTEQGGGDTLMRVRSQGGVMEEALVWVCSLQALNHHVC